MKAKTNGIETYYELHGREGAPWLVLSHSLACSVRMWDPQIAALKDRYRILAYDTRGHGASEAPKGAYTLEMLADDLKALLDALGVKDPHYCGLSMGGMIGQTFALKYPGVFRTLMLADTTSGFPAQAAPLWQERIRIAEAKGMQPLVQPTLERWFTEAFRKSQPAPVAGIAQLIYLVLFSFAHFFEGLTGLIVTVGSILTLFALMQLTGRLRWAEVLRKPEAARA